MTMRLSLSLLLAPALAHAAGGTVVSAVVYPERTQVTRARASGCGARSSAVFDQIPPSADPASFRAAARGGTIEGLRFEEQTHQAFGAEFKTAEAAVKKLESDQAALVDARKRNQGASDLAVGFHGL